MKSFVYYEIAGFLPSSFVSHRLLGNVVNYESRAKAIEVLEGVIKEWKEQESFCSGGELIDETILSDGNSLDYQHQFVFKGNRTGMVKMITYQVVKHKIFYNE